MLGLLSICRSLYESTMAINVQTLPDEEIGERLPIPHPIQVVRVQGPRPRSDVAAHRFRKFSDR